MSKSLVINNLFLKWREKMKLIKCPQCEWIVTPKTVKCPKCGIVVVDFKKKSDKLHNPIEPPALMPEENP